MEGAPQTPTELSSPNGQPQNAPPPDTALMCLAMLAQYFERPADLAQLHHDFAPDGQPVNETHLLRAAKELGFKAKALNLDLQRIDKAPLPVIGQWKDVAVEITEEVPAQPACSVSLGPLEGMGLAQEKTESDEPQTVTKTIIKPGGYFILAKMAKGEDGAVRVLVQDPARAAESNGLAELDLAAFADKFSGRTVCLASRAELAAKEMKFDLSWFIPAVVRYRKLFGEVLLASLFIQIFALISPLFFQVVIDKVLVHRGLSSLDVLIFALIVVALFEILFGTLRTYLFSHTTNRIDVQLGSKLYKHLMQLPIAYFGARRVGETVARVRELENVRSFLTGSALTLVLDLAFTVVFFAVMFYYAPILTWIVVGSLPFYFAISLLITPTLRARVEEMFQRGAENTAFLTESISGVETVKAMAVEPQMHRRWEERLAEYVKASFKAAMLGNFAQNGVQLVQKITMGLTLYFGAKVVIAGDLTVGQLVAFNMLSGHVTGPILRLAQLWQDFQKMRISVERLGDILNTRTEVAGGQTDLPPVRGAIKFEGVTFRYRHDTPEVLKNITIDIPVGQAVGIVGPSGSGKSTLTKLVQRMYVPESGKVLVDGMDLALASPAWLRRQIGVVLQENYLFNRTVWENIAISQPALPRERIIEAAKLAGAHDFIQALPEAYDTVLGERGGTLSGGQRQRIAIARALVTNPKILIFDEATSALDYESEEIIQQNMRHICQDRTVLIIAHRLSTVRNCDRIITVEAGQIVEDGSHETLIQTDGRYARLWRHQMAGIGITVQPAPHPVPTMAENDDTATKAIPQMGPQMRVTSIRRHNDDRPPKRAEGA
ncbi:MAG: type I secretion system permease/ATPase [Rhodospirillales bacterium]|nr:type I secretion system permease/ATPase [Rhodospirillales bacterium]